MNKSNSKYCTTTLEKLDHFVSLLIRFFHFIKTSATFTFVYDVFTFAVHGASRERDTTKTNSWDACLVFDGLSLALALALL